MVALISIVIVGGAAFIAYFTTTGKMRASYETKLTFANQEMAENKRNVYVAKEDIVAGGIITKDNTEYKNIYASQAQDSYISKSDIGKTALINIDAGTHIIKSLITETNVSSDLRETSYDVVTNSTNVINNDTVDIRVLFPNGENYIVLSKKKILSMTEESTECYFWLSEEEILRMSSAIVDAYLYEGTQVYSVEYIEPSLQEASIVNYTPSLATLELIKKDPNIVAIASEYLSNVVRKELENRLALSTDLDVTAVEWDTQNNLIDTTSSEDNTSESDAIYFEEEEKTKKEEMDYGE